jgi:hypothetical protein
MRAALKRLLILEVVICFGPLILWWGMGLIFFGVQIVGLFHDFNEVAPGALLVFALVAAGAIGLMALLEVLRSIFNPSASLMNPKVTLLFAGIGLAPVVWIVGGVPWVPWMLIGLVPMVATIHMVYRGRHYLFPHYRNRD